jgi:hypothetical protein
MATTAKAKSSTPPRPKVGGKPGVWFSEAVTLLAERCGAVDRAEHLLIEGLRDGRVPWSWLRKDGVRVAGDAAFWGDIFLMIDPDRAKNRAFHGAPIHSGSVPDPCDVSGICVQRAAVLALLPGARRRKSTGAPPKYDAPGLQRIGRDVLASFGFGPTPLESLEGEGGLLEKVSELVPEAKMPSRSRAIEILKPVWDEFKSLR